MIRRRDALGLAAGMALLPGLLRPRGAHAQAGAPLVHRFGPPQGPWPVSPRKVFAAGPPAAVLLATLAPERLLGWPMTLSREARALLPPATRERPTLGRLAGRGSTVSVEALLALQPDLILDAGTVDGTYLSAAQRVAGQTGLPYALIDGRLADTPRQLVEAGQLLGVPERAQALARMAEQALAAAPPASGPRPGVYLARGADGLETALAGAINGEIIEAAGGRNVAVSERGGGVARVSLEQVLGWMPDWVLTQDVNFFQRARSDAVWRTLPAVREGRLLLAPSQPFGWIDGPPGVNRLLGLRWLGAALRSGRPPGPEALDQALQLHRLLYGTAPARAAWQALLDGRA